MTKLQKDREPPARLSQTLSTMVESKSDRRSSPFSSDQSKAEQRLFGQRAGGQIPQFYSAENVRTK